MIKLTWLCLVSMIWRDLRCARKAEADPEERIDKCQFAWPHELTIGGNATAVCTLEYVERGHQRISSKRNTCASNIMWSTPFFQKHLQKLA